MSRICVLQADTHDVSCIDALPVVSKAMVAQLMTDRAELTPGLPGPRVPLLKLPFQSARQSMKLCHSEPS